MPAGPAPAALPWGLKTVNSAPDRELGQFPDKGDREMMMRSRTIGFMTGVCLAALGDRRAGANSRAERPAYRRRKKAPWRASWSAPRRRLHHHHHGGDGRQGPVQLSRRSPRARQIYNLHPRRRLRARRAEGRGNRGRQGCQGRHQAQQDAQRHDAAHQCGMAQQARPARISRSCSSTAAAAATQCSASSCRRTPPTNGSRSSSA